MDDKELKAVLEALARGVDVRQPSAPVVTEEQRERVVAELRARGVSFAVHNWLHVSPHRHYWR